MIFYAYLEGLWVFHVPSLHQRCCCPFFPDCWYCPNQGLSLFLLVDGQWDWPSGLSHTCRLQVRASSGMLDFTSSITVSSFSPQCCLFPGLGPLVSSYLHCSGEPKYMESLELVSSSILASGYSVLQVGICLLVLGREATLLMWLSSFWDEKYKTSDFLLLSKGPDHIHDWTG